MTGHGTFVLGMPVGFSTWGASSGSGLAALGCVLNTQIQHLLSECHGRRCSDSFLRLLSTQLSTWTGLCAPAGIPFLLENVIPWLQVRNKWKLP